MNKKVLTIAIAGAMAPPMSAHAIKWKMSGQLNRAVSVFDDGAKSDIRSVDNDTSNTRFRMKGTEDLGDGMKIGAYWELSIESSPSDKAFPDANTDNDGGVGIRQANVWFSGNWGKLSLGQLSEAADGATDVDLSGTALTHSGSTRTDNSAGMKWQGTGTANRGVVFSNEGSTYSNMDGGRKDVLRYDSPKLGPIGIAVNIGNDQTWSVKADVNTPLGGGQLGAAVFYLTNTGAQNTEHRFGGSASYLFSQGTSISGHYADNETEAGLDSKSFSVSLGHQWGPHAVQASYSEANDYGGRDIDNTGYAVEYVHTLKKVNTKLYAGFLHSELDGPAGFSYDDHNIFTVGALVKFD